MFLVRMFNFGGKNYLYSLIRSGKQYSKTLSEVTVDCLGKTETIPLLSKSGNGITNRIQNYVNGAVYSMDNLGHTLLSDSKNIVNLKVDKLDDCRRGSGYLLNRYAIKQSGGLGINGITDFDKAKVALRKIAALQKYSQQ